MKNLIHQFTKFPGFMRTRREIKNKYFELENRCLFLETQLSKLQDRQYESLKISVQNVEFLKAELEKNIRFQAEVIPLISNILKLLTSIQSSQNNLKYFEHSKLLQEKYGLLIREYLN